jgi:hypothetical protein
MLKLELDWAGSAPAPVGTDPDDENIRVEWVSRAGPSGHPVIAVYAGLEPGEPEYMAYMRLVSWLTAEYGSSEAEAEELQDHATVV